jgi:hypothetical protein
MSPQVIGVLVMVKLGIGLGLVFIVCCWVDARIGAAQRRRLERAARAQVVLARRAGDRVDADYRARAALLADRPRHVAVRIHVPEQPTPKLRRVS